MTNATPASTDTAPKSRDADNTRLLLLDAARRRFAYDGYTGTTVRDIAADAGVNIALINRYFTSKEGLFEACLAQAGKVLDPPADAATTVDEAVERMVSHVVALPTGDTALQLLLLLRSSGDERADRIRRDTLAGFAERMAVAAGWRPGDPKSEHLLLRAQLALSASMGIVLLRSSKGLRLEPLASAGAAELTAPIGDILSALVSPTGRA